jgi:hypothetical protein
MKAWIVVVCVGLVIAALIGICRMASTDQNVERNEQVQRQLAIADQNQRTADKVVNNGLYIKDPRTNLCYFYYWGGKYNGGPALTAIPCEAVVPSTLLITGRVSK